MAHTKCACFMKISTNVAIESYPSAKGKLDIKSMDIVSHGLLGLGRGIR